MRLAGKTAMVTGGASGFGAGIVRKFVEEGAKVIIADIDLDQAQALATQLGDSAISAHLDVSDGKAVKQVIQNAQTIWGDLDILVNNAGTAQSPQPLNAVSEGAFDKIAAVNMKSIFWTTKAILPVFESQKAGVILNMASTAGVSPRPGLTWYNASKGWVITATRSMAVELASKNIRVNAINPVAGETPMLQTFMGEDTPEIRAKFLSSIPLGRFSTPQDMGHAACYLCSDEASMVTGVCLEVDGGRCI
ncbi:MAG TPA: glucose 1-dehydrogenase [Hellea balneolensis]|uniref:Glucose 1-dehydrogenase n=1 Tax=Hellea balneolensis TaxID=287478 RepID=A0A7C5R0Q1_9PROT|nr:glucose 1-dehydrogenase [Hellea balneolensis]